METLKLRTKQSIYPSIKVEIDGVLYESRKFTHQLFLLIDPVQKKIEGGKSDDDKPDSIEAQKEVWEAYCVWMMAVFGIPKDITENLEQSEVEDIYMKVKVALLQRQKVRMSKSVAAIKAEVDGIGDTIKGATEIKETVGDIEKNVKRSGKTQ